MAVHIIGSGARGVVEIANIHPFHAVLRVGGIPSPEGTLATARVFCPRKGCIEGSECTDCVHLQAWRATPDVRLYCSVDDTQPVTDWMRPKPPATTVDTRCYAAEQFAAARGVHHLLVFDRRLALVGVACRCDLGRDPQRPVGEAMSSEVFAVEPATSIGTAAAAMKQLRIACLPVVSGPLVLGILTGRDLDRAGAPVEDRPLNRS